MKIAIACDHGAYALKEIAKKHLSEQGYEVRDFGTDSLDSCDYPDFAGPAALAVASGECDKGIVL
ncbi:MAG: RpiB/LacA/LacB family sugar-phosphate isomerase, partial [Oscillospiraceae bacterium]|nr:RpiB/LacA/LacB family sugar-phosphate isomerase [Oscillospiraceae bacterium]